MQVTILLSPLINQGILEPVDLSDALETDFLLVIVVGVLAGMYSSL